MQKLYSIFVRIIRYTVNACLVIVSYEEKHTTDRTEIANLESKVAFNFLPIIRYTVNVNLVIVSYKQKHESGMGTVTTHRELYVRIQKLIATSMYINSKMLLIYIQANESTQLIKAFSF